MATRLDFRATAPQAVQILVQLEGYFHQTFSSDNPLSKTTWELVKLRVAQIQQCAYCIDMHSKEAQKFGENTERIIALSAWRKTLFYSKPERIALNLAELLCTGKEVNEETYVEAEETLGDKALVDLIIAINAIHSWTQLAKVFKLEVGLG